MLSIRAWTDGSLNKDGGGWCAIIAAVREDVKERDIAEMVHTVSGCFSSRTDVTSRDDRLRAKVSILRGYEKETTNNRMELQGILEVLKAMKGPATLTIITDSRYAIDVLTKRKQAHTNLDLVAEWMSISKGHNVTFAYVPGHAGHPMNEWCDTIARIR